MSKPMFETDTCECVTCGFKWVKGKDGSHSCTEWMAKTITRWEKTWRNENRVILLLIAGGFVKESKVDEARALLGGVEE